MAVPANMLARPFFDYRYANPIEQAGTYPLPEARSLAVSFSISN